MNTTGPVTTVTDELLAELEQQSVRDPGGAFPVRYAVISELTAELRRLRAENAELAKDAGRWRYAAKQDSAGEVDICITQVTWNIFSETYRILTAENADSITDRAMATQ